MPLNDKDLAAVRLLFQEELQGEVGPLRYEMQNQFDEIQNRFSEIQNRFDQIADQIEGLYHANEKREQEYLMINEQTKRTDKRLSLIERKLKKAS